MKLQKILLPFDGSPLAEAALPKAVELIEGLRSETAAPPVGGASDLSRSG